MYSRWIDDLLRAGLDAGWIETDLRGRFHSGPGFCLDAADGPEPNDGRGGVPGKI